MVKDLTRTHMFAIIRAKRTAAAPGGADRPFFVYDHKVRR